MKIATWDTIHRKQLPFYLDNGYFQIMYVRARVYMCIMERTILLKYLKI